MGRCYNVRPVALYRTLGYMSLARDTFSQLGILLFLKDHFFEFQRRIHLAWGQHSLRAETMPGPVRGAWVRPAGRIHRHPSR
jgi:hypothetical protein